MDTFEIVKIIYTVYKQHNKFFNGMPLIAIRRSYYHVMNRTIEEDIKNMDVKSYLIRKPGVVVLRSRCGFDWLFIESNEQEENHAFLQSLYFDNRRNILMVN